MELPKRKNLRLKNFDYSENGHYFVTICTDKHKKILSSIIVGEGLAPPEIELSPLGKIVEEQISCLSVRYPKIKLEKYVIMPDHIHLLIFIDGYDAGGASPSPTLSDIICSLKSLTTRIYKQKYNVDKIWQRGYTDHIIRNEADYLKHFNYIEDNPIMWAIGKEFI